MSVHVGIIDNDPVRLITAVLHQKDDVDKLILIGTAEQKQQFTRFTDILTPKGIDSEFFQIPSNVSISDIKSSIHSLAKSLKDRGDEVFFNASCGLRHRLLSAYEVFRSYGWHIYVIEPFSDELCWLYPDSKKHQQVEDHIGINDYLTLFGARSELQDETIVQSLDKKVKYLGEKWAGNAQELGPGLATLNYLATTCRKEQKLDVELSEKQQGYRELAMLIDDLKDVELASYDRGVLCFANEEARRFANGEWLECYVHYLVGEIQHELLTIQDNSLGVQVYRKIGDIEVRNELDVATVVNNKLHIIECKTKSMSNDGDDTLYKLESLRDLLGGLQARAMLVSFRPLRHHDVTRAKDLGLALVGPEHLGDLKNCLFNWFLGAGGLDNANPVH